MTWSPGDVDVGIQSLLIQFYPILLSTLLSINRNQLSTLDARFALLLSSSPLTIYLVVTSICDLFGIHTGLYKRIKSHRPIVRALGALVLPLWTGLSVTLSISARAFKDSSCEVLTFADWLRDTAISLLALFPVLNGAPGPVFWGFLSTLALLWCFCMLRSMSQLKADGRLNREGLPTLRGFWTLLKKIWCVPVYV